MLRMLGDTLQMLGAMMWMLGAMMCVTNQGSVAADPSVNKNVARFRAHVVQSESHVV